MAAVSDAVARPSSPLGIGMRSALSAMGISTYSTGRFDSFEPDNPYAKPTDLYIPSLPENQCIPPNGYWASRGAIHTNKETYYADGHGSLFLYHGTWFTVIPMDNPGDWGWVKWPNVGTYKGRSIGCKLTVSNPKTVNTYNSWGHPDGWPGNAIAGKPLYWGTRHFFVACDCFSSVKCHWLLGLSSLKMTYEFFYTGDENNFIDLEWAYLTEHSIQCDGGGYEWAGPADNHQGHAFTPSGVSTVLRWTNHDWHDCVESPYDEISDRTTVMFDYKGRSISCWRGDTVGQDGFVFEFLPIADFCALRLKKTSTNPAVTPIDPEYFSLAGAEYAIFCDEACTRKCGTFTTDENGEATLSAVNGTNKLIANMDYWVKETSAPQGYKIDETAHKIRLAGDMTIEVSDVPKHSTVHFMLVDTLGDTQEVHTVYMKLNTMYRASDHEADFSDARAALEQVMRGEGQDMSLLDKCLDGWYEGDDKCSDPSIFQGGKYVGRKVNGDLYLWTRVRMGRFNFYKDGTDKDHLVFRSQRYLTGTVYTFPSDLISKSLEPTCNLNDRFGTDPSTGFTGWHLDMKLGDGAITNCTAGTGITALYGRNRCTLRTEYAPGSVELDPSWDMRLLPEEGAEAHPGFIPVFEEPKHKGYDAKGKEFELAAINDSGEGHTAYYWDELARITVPATAYRNIGGGQWRTYKCEAWLDADEANAAVEVSESGISGHSRTGARAGGAVKITMDTVRYIRWSEVVVDGVVGVRRK